MRASPYGQYCPIAQALDLLGERWTLLILRELAHAPARFSDLQAANPGLGPTLLSRRLTELQDAGLIDQRDLPSPGRGTVYQLTDHGRSAVPVLHALGRFGAQLLPEADAPRDRLEHQLVLHRRAVVGKHPTVEETVVLQLNDQRFTLHIGPDRFDLLEAEPAAPAAVVAVTLRTMATLANGGTTIAEAERAGQLTITGTRAAGLRLLRYLSIAPVR